MKISLIGAELEENLGMRYIASSLEDAGHAAKIIPFNYFSDIPEIVRKVKEFEPGVIGLSMVFTLRGAEFCKLAGALRDSGFKGHIIAGGPFASFNAENILWNFPQFDSIAIGEGEKLMPSLIENLFSLENVRGLCYRTNDGAIKRTEPGGNPDDLDTLPFPKRDHFSVFFDKPVASILSSRGCWRNCAFCSIDAWYSHMHGKKFRMRSIENIVREMKELYFNYGVRVFNFQDDNFYHPDPKQALTRFTQLRDRLTSEGVQKIGIAIKARPDSITRESVKVLSDLGLIRVFLGVENASENGLRNLNRKQSIDDIIQSIDILNDVDVHVAYNFLLFEPDTVMDDILTNLRFMERYFDNPFNFCRAEVHSCTGLEDKLKKEGLLLGDFFRPDYRIKDPRVELFHDIANQAFFERNFGDDGVHYLNMEIDFTRHLLKVFNPETLTRSLRAKSLNFVRQINLDTYQYLCEIYDFVKRADPIDQVRATEFAGQLKTRIDSSDNVFKKSGQEIVFLLSEIYEGSVNRGERTGQVLPSDKKPDIGAMSADASAESGDWIRSAIFSSFPGTPIPYDEFKRRIRSLKTESA